MKNLENGLPVIIEDKANFSCALGIVKGLLELTVMDEGSSSFPVIVKVNTNLGSGSMTVKLDGNKTEKRSVSSVDVEVKVSNWKCDDNELSFHVKAVAKKKVVFKTVDCTVYDRTLKGMRHNKAIHEKQVASVFEMMEQE